MAPIFDRSPVTPPKAARKTSAQQQLLEEFRARNRAFPTLNRMATGRAIALGFTLKQNP